LALDRDVLDSKMVFPVVGQALVEGAVLFWSDVRWIASPDGFRLVELLLGGLYLDLFGFLLFLLLFFVDLLNLVILFCVFVFLFFVFYFLQRQLSTSTYDAYT
jgi:hypothetical protein